MTSLGAFFRLTARPRLMFFFPFSLLIGWVMTVMLREWGADPLIVNAFVVPTLMGVIGGQLLHELQHSMFTWTLPGVERRTLGGFVAAGAILGLFMAAVLAPDPPLAVFVVALSGYCLGSLFGEPLGAALVTLPAALLVLVFSRAIGEHAATRPEAVVAVAGVVCGLCLWRMFSRSTHRRKLFVPTSPTNEHHRAGHRWAGTYLGTDLGRWTRAAAYETYGSLGPRELLKTGGMVLLFLLYLVLPIHLKAGDVGARWETVYHAFLRPPDMPSVSENGAYLLIPLVICLAGLVLVSSGPVALSRGRFYPLSRRELGRLAYRGYLMTAVAFCLMVAAFCFGLGLVAGSLSGSELRLDFVPLWLRGVLWTLAVLPLGQWFHVQAQEEEKRRSSESALVRIDRVFLIIGICFVPMISVLLLPSPVGLAVVTVLVVAGQAIFRQSVLRYFATADLA